MYEKVSPDQILAEFRKRGLDPYKIYTLDLSIVRTDIEIDICGKVFQVIASSLSNPLISVRFNDPANGLVPFRLYQKMIIPFEKVYINNTAQAGSITILYAQEYKDISEMQFFFEKIFYKDEFIYIDN